MSHNVAAMPVIEKAIVKARTHAEAPPTSSAEYDSWVAWIVVNELRLAGWKIVPPEGFSLKDSFFPE